MLFGISANPEPQRTTDRWNRRKPAKQKDENSEPRAQIRRAEIELSRVGLVSLVFGRRVPARWKLDYTRHARNPKVPQHRVPVLISDPPEGRKSEFRG